ncbi:Vacuolar-processing enzyme delta-isozyme [Raphanus sativus]|nr:Vacuolar-processing enzyme delta-isozyme [Raphanus sativus]
MSFLGHFQLLVFLYALLLLSAESRKTQVFHDTESNDDGEAGTRWALLVAGSKGYENNRHQADICHAYQLLRKGGLQDENIIVFMYDDIAFNPKNPRSGVIINRPGGENVYHGVHKDYTGGAVNVDKFFSVLLGNESGVTGGSGKVVKSGPLIYYADHELTAMPTGDGLYAEDFIKVLEKMNILKRYKKMI